MNFQRARQVVRGFHPRRVRHRRPNGPPLSDRRRGSQESGYAYLFALLAIIIVTLASTAAMQNMLTSGRRQREDDMLWRGNQVVRAVRLYYHITGRYPTSLDDFQNGVGASEIHVLRTVAYKDPTNTTDGTWRFIYTNAAGQIIGSVRYATLAQMVLMDQNHGLLPVSTQEGQAGVPASSLASPPAGPAGADSQASPQTAQTVTSGPGAAATLLQPTGPVTGQVLGAFLDGVAGTSDTPSVKVYKGGKTYLQWEFIWNPLEDQAAALAQGLGQGQALIPGQPGVPVAPGAGGAAEGPFVIGAAGGTSATPPPMPAPQNPTNP
jgi:type II secretory pathway pseudopilin PulG